MASLIISKPIKATYFKIKPGSNTVPPLNTRIVELKGVEFDYLKINTFNLDK